MAPPSGRRTGLQFTALGFPVRIDVSFVVVMALLGLSGATTSVSRVVVWVVLGAAAVLAHELGHALVARTTGARPTIELYSFGGLTSYAPPGPISRARSLAISVTGPFVGIAIGLAVMALVPSQTRFGPQTLGDYAREAAIFTNLGWGVLNLLPVLPLDGGHALAELLPGDPAVRARRAAVVSVPVAAALAVVALTQQYLFGALLAGWLAVGNVRTVMASGSGDRLRLPPPAGPTQADRDALWLVEQGRADQARHLLATLPPDQPADPAVHGLVLAMTGRPEQGGALVRQAHAQAPDDPLRTDAYAMLLIAQRDWPALGQLAEESPDRVPVRLVVTGHEAALRTGAPRSAAALGELALPRAGESAPSLARSTALAWTRAGAPDQALRVLSDAADHGTLGPADVAALDGDPELAPVRDLPAYGDLRARAAGHEAR